PDGGWRAWANVLGGFLVLFASLGLVSAFGVFQVYFVQHRYTSHTESQISWIGSCQLCLFFLLALVAGPLFDKGRFRYLIGAGSVLWTLSVFLMPEAQTYGQCMFVQGILGGLGVGLLFLSVQSHWFEKRRSLAVGIVASGSSVGGICFPIMLNKLIANPDVGFATAVRAVGAVVAVSLLIANLIMSPHPARKVVQKPPLPPLKQIFTLTYTSYVIGAFILNWGMWFPNFYVQLYFLRQHASEQATYYALAIFNAGSFVGRVLPGIAADLFFGPLNMQVICCLCSGITIYLMVIMTSEAMLILWALLCGFFTGGFVSLVSPVIVSISDNNLAEIGLRQGIAFVLIAGAAVGGNPVCGRLIANRNGDFLDSIMFAGSAVVLGALVALVGRMAFARQRGTWRV
ncbi:MFS general substrate transporter, partial [Rhodotorula sp. JG-1b]